MPRKQNVDDQAARLAMLRNRREALGEELGKIQQKLGYDDFTFAAAFGIGQTELENWKNGVGRPTMELFNNIQSHVLAAHEGMAESKIEQEGIDLSKARNMIADLDRAAGASPYQGGWRGR